MCLIVFHSFCLRESLSGSEFIFHHLFVHLLVFKVFV
jgi:hypothetical protein